MKPVALPRDDLDAFEADLLSGGIVTHVLEAWCGGRVHAEVQSGVRVEPTADQRERLGIGIGIDAPVGFRRVRLMHGDIVLSQADNWYVASRLTPAMNVALADSDTPFGVVIRPLEPVRHTLAVERLGIGDHILRLSALVVGGDGRPLAEVAELYRRACLLR